MYTYEYPRPAFGCDNVITALDTDNVWKVLLIERKHDPFGGMWALPGGFVNENEDLIDAAARELEEETGVTGCDLVQLGAWGGPGRDPRGWVVTVAFVAIVDIATVHPKGADDAAQAAWHPLYDLPPLAFDHAEIIAAAIRKHFSV